MSIFLHVDGIPRPQGSKRLVRGRMIESARGHRQWREQVALAALRAKAEQAVTRGCQFPIAAPVSVSILFAMPGRADRRPDIDKLVRAVLDALTESGLIADDALVVSLMADKRQAGANESPGACVVITQAQEEADDQTRHRP